MTKSLAHRVTFSVLALTLLSAVAVGAWRVQARLQPVAPLPERPLPVETLVVEPGSLTSSRRYTGTLEAVERITLSARVTGTLQELPFREGEWVTEGALVARLDAAELTAEVTRLEAAVARAAADLRFWEAQLVRDEKLFADGRIAARNRDESQRQAENTRAVLKESRQSLAAARTRLGYTKLNAPFAGRVQRVAAEPGELLTPGKPILELVGESGLKAVLSVPQVDLAALRPGAVAHVSVAGGPAVAAKVTRLLPALDASTRTGQIEVALPPGGGLRPGMHVVADVDFATLQGALSVPRQAVLQRNGETGVFVLYEGHAHWQPVQERLTNGSRVAVSGLTAGESVIVTPHPALQDGSEVGVHNDWRASP